MSKGMFRICMVQFFSWFAWFTFILFITTWVGENIFHGDASAPEHSVPLEVFEAGVRFGALGLSIFAGATIICSVLLPFCTKYIGIKPIFFGCQLLLAFCLFLPVWIETKYGALILISACGIPWTAVMVFPFTIVAMSVKESECGLYIGVLNIFVVIPQILVSLGIGFVVDFFHGNLVAGMVTGGFSALISAILVWTLILKERSIEIVEN